jgi:hypothetical protein
VSGIFARVVNIHGRQRGGSIDEWKVIAVVEVTVTVRKNMSATKCRWARAAALRDGIGIIDCFRNKK